MSLKITDEQRAAMDDWPGPVQLIDEQTKRRYYLVEASIFERLESDATVYAIQRGIADCEAGRTSSVEEVRASIKASLEQRSKK